MSAMIAFHFLFNILHPQARLPGLGLLPARNVVQFLMGSYCAPILRYRLHKTAGQLHIDRASWQWQPEGIYQRFKS